MKYPAGTVWATARDVRDGRIVWHEGYWGVMIRWGRACAIDRWHAPYLQVRGSERVRVDTRK
jgi:hypothetical protein